MNAIKTTGFCEFCNKITINNKAFIVYRIGFSTNLGEFNVGVLNLSEELADFLMKRGSHLSGSQVMLLRPDIMLEFLKHKYNSNEEKVMEYHLCDAEICYNCFKKYVEKVPER